MTLTTDDRMLLGLAAKAAGIELLQWSDEWVGEPDCSGFQTKALDRWNPLEDDSDALRLAVKLKMEVYHSYDEGDGVAAGYPEAKPRIAYCIEYYKDEKDPYAATRRAIVRAAAAIGEFL